MKHLVSALMMSVITTAILPGFVFAQSSAALDEIAAKYKACIKTELEASSNGDSTYDEVFFLEGREHCDKMKASMIRIVKLKQRRSDAEQRIAALTESLIAGAKGELGLQ